jgi:hypothetical protein
VWLCLPLLKAMGIELGLGPPWCVSVLEHVCVCAVCVLWVCVLYICVCVLCICVSVLYVCMYMCVCVLYICAVYVLCICVCCVCMCVWCVLCVSVLCICVCVCCVCICVLCVYVCVLCVYACVLCVVCMWCVLCVSVCAVYMCALCVYVCKCVLCVHGCVLHPATDLASLCWGNFQLPGVWSGALYRNSTFLPMTSRGQDLLEAGPPSSPFLGDWKLCTRAQLIIFLVLSLGWSLAGTFLDGPPLSLTRGPTGDCVFTQQRRRSPQCCGS